MPFRESGQIDPGLLYVHGLYMFFVNGPWAVQRNRKRSVSGYQNGIHGDAAFADYAVLASVSRRF